MNQPKTIPVNPAYDWDLDPSQQAEYFNPVVLCNKEVYYANAIIEITQALTGVNKELAERRNQLQYAKARKRDLDEVFLVSEELTKEHTKNKELQNAFVRAKLLASPEYGPEYQEVTALIANLENRITELQVKMENGRMALDSLKLVSQNIQTALSFYKAELKTSYR